MSHIEVTFHGFCYFMVVLNKCSSLFQKLTKGKDSWSLAEVIHAIVILTHFHSLCSFVFSCGVNQEVDQPGGYKYQIPGQNGSCALPTSNTNQTNPKDIPAVDITEGKQTRLKIS